MVSRSRILSRSRDTLHMNGEGDGVGGGPGGMRGHPMRNVANYFKEEEDVWYLKEKLYRDHIDEVLGKWHSIDDEIWAKVIVLERNRRVAKAYARAPVLTVNGSEDGFDGFRIGVNGFENPLRDPKTAEFKLQIGAGCKMKMDETGNILIKRFSDRNVFVKNTLDDEGSAISNDILKMPQGAIEAERPMKLFDMKKFQQNVNRELKRSRPDRRRLECQCVSSVAFVKNEPELLDSPIWIMLINVVALEMLRAKMPNPGEPQMGHRSSQQSGIPSTPSSSRPGVRHSSEPRKRFGLPLSGSSDEDPYSLTPSGSSGSSGKGHRGENGQRSSDNNTSSSGQENGGHHGHGLNGRLMHSREREYYGPQNWAKYRQQPDSDDENTLKRSKSKTNLLRGGIRGNGRSKDKSADKRKTNGPAAISAGPRPGDDPGDDPYYCGLRARVPNFAKNKDLAKSNGKSPVQKGMKSPAPSRSVPNLQMLGQPSPVQLPGAGPNPFWWHSRLYPDATTSSVADVSNYHYAGRMGNRGYRPSPAVQTTAFPAAPMMASNGRLLPITPTTPSHRRPIFRTGWE